VTDRQRASALLLLGSGREEIVPDSEIDRVLRSMAPSYVVRVRRTPEGTVYRATAAGQRWAVSQLSSHPAHSGQGANLMRVRADLIEEGPGGHWRVIDSVRRVRTLWMHRTLRTPPVEKAARQAVSRARPRASGWVVVEAV